MAKEIWLHIIGLGEDGLDGLPKAARGALDKAEIIVGGKRHHDLTKSIAGERLHWPSPFDAMVETLQSHKGKQVVVLVTGDPLWYSAGEKLFHTFPFDEIAFYPQISSFQWAALRMGWPLQSVQTLTVHGRATAQIVLHIAPHAQLLILTKDHTSPKDVAALLSDRGYGASELTVLASLGGPDEQRFDGLAENWAHDVPDFHVLAVRCIAGPKAQVLPRTGLPDDCFTHDGKITKRVVRAITLAKLVPHVDALLWDIGAGSGSIGIEWMRAAMGAKAIGIEHNPKRRAMAEINAMQLGVPDLVLRDGLAPDILHDLDAPDAVFFGGGISREAINIAIEKLKPHGRLVANAVTLESEAVLLATFAEFGGEMQRISVDTADKVGPFHGWRPSMPVTQWSWTKTL